MIQNMNITIIVKDMIAIIVTGMVAIVLDATRRDIIRGNITDEILVVRLGIIVADVVIGLDIANVTTTDIQGVKDVLVVIKLNKLC